MGVPGKMCVEVPGKKDEVPGKNLEVPQKNEEVPGTKFEVPGKNDGGKCGSVGENVELPG